MNIMIKGDWTTDRVEVQIDGFVNCFVYYTEHVEQLVQELEKLFQKFRHLSQADFNMEVRYE